MTAHVYTTQEKLDEVERLIEEERNATGRRNELLKAVAQDLRGRLDGAPTVAMTMLEQRVNHVVRCKTNLGYDQVALATAGLELLSRWPAVKQSLERFAAEVQS